MFITILCLTIIIFIKYLSYLIFLTKLYLMKHFFFFLLKNVLRKQPNFWCLEFCHSLVFSFSTEGILFKLLFIKYSCVTPPDDSTSTARQRLFPRSLRYNAAGITGDETWGYIISLVAANKTR